MKAEIAKQWVEALRSGKYEKGRGCLHPAVQKFCCLGVLCDISGLGRWTTNKHGDGVYNGSACYLPERVKIGSACYLPERVKDWAGINTSVDGSSVSHHLIGRLIACNDSDDYDFAKIADIIEKVADQL